MVASTGRNNTLSYSDKRVIVDKLETVCRTTPDGFAEYEEGWDDLKMVAWAAAELQRDVTYGNIRGLRREVIGATRKRRSAEEIAAELKAELEAKLALKASFKSPSEELQGLAMQMRDLAKEVRKQGLMIQTLQTHILEHPKPKSEPGFVMRAYHPNGSDQPF